jgi:hypothetical protein
MVPSYYEWNVEMLALGEWRENGMAGILSHWATAPFCNVRIQTAHHTHHRTNGK